MEEKIKSELRPGEEILWSGKAEEPMNTAVRAWRRTGAWIHAESAEGISNDVPSLFACRTACDGGVRGTRSSCYLRKKRK